MAWIRVDQSIRDHRKIYDLSDALNISVPLTIGLLICLWLWGMDNTTSGNLDGISARTIARAAKWDGDPEQLLDALIDSGFIDVDDAGRKFIHDWAEYEGKYISARECERERSRSRRNSQRVDNQRSTDGRTAVDQKTADGKEDKTKQDQSIAAGNKADETTTSDPVPYEQIVMLYNNICVDMHEVRTITPKRRAAMGECWAEYGQLFFSTNSSVLRRPLLSCTGIVIVAGARTLTGLFNLKT